MGSREDIETSTVHKLSQNPHPLATFVSRLSHIVYLTVPCSLSDCDSCLYLTELRSGLFSLVSPSILSDGSQCEGAQAIGTWTSDEGTNGYLAAAPRREGHLAGCPSNIKELGAGLW